MRNFTRNLLKKSFLPVIFRPQNSSKITKREFSGNYFRNSFVSEGSVPKVVCDPVAVFACFQGIQLWLERAPRSPKHIAIITVWRSYLSPLFFLLGRDPCGDRILRSCLQKGPAAALANYGSKHNAVETQVAFDSTV